VILTHPASVFQARLDGRATSAFPLAVGMHRDGPKHQGGRLVDVAPSQQGVPHHHVGRAGVGWLGQHLPLESFGAYCPELVALNVTATALAVRAITRARQRRQRRQPSAVASSGLSE